MTARSLYRSLLAVALLAVVILAASCGSSSDQDAGIGQTGTAGITTLVFGTQPADGTDTSSTTAPTTGQSATTPTTEAPTTGSPTPPADVPTGLCGGQPAIFAMATTQFDIAICGDSSASSYVAEKRGTDEGITLAACQVAEFTWMAENKGYVYLVQGTPEGMSNIEVTDPSGDVILDEDTTTRSDGTLRRYYGPDGQASTC